MKRAKRCEQTTSSNERAENEKNITGEHNPIYIGGQPEMLRTSDQRRKKTRRNEKQIQFKIK